MRVPECARVSNVHDDEGMRIKEMYDARISEYSEGVKENMNV